MNDDTFEAVVNRRTVRRLRRQSGYAAGTTHITPIETIDPTGATEESEDPLLEEFTTGRARLQARAAYAGTAGAKIAPRNATTSTSIHRGGISVPTTIRLDDLWITVSGWGAAGTELAQHLDIVSRVQRYADLARVEPTNTFVTAPLGIMYVPHHEVHERVSAFAIDTAHIYTASLSAAPLLNPNDVNNYGIFTISDAHLHGGPYVAPVAFNRVEPVHRYETRANRLFALLQNGAAHGTTSTNRLRRLQQAAEEEGEPFSLDALEALAVFANAHPDMPPPEITVSPAGGIITEWRSRHYSVTLYFVSLIEVQYLVKRRNPWHVDLPERSSGVTSVDRIGESVRDRLPLFAWPTRA